MATPLTLAALVDDPGRRLVWAITEQAIRDLANPRERTNAAEFLHEVLPIMAAGIAPDAVNQAIQHWQAHRYSRVEAAKLAQAEDGAGARPVRLHFGRRRR